MKSFSFLFNSLCAGLRSFILNKCRSLLGGVRGTGDDSKLGSSYQCRSCSPGNETGNNQYTGLQSLVLNRYLLFFLLTFILSACDSTPEKQLTQLSGQTMGTYYRVSLVIDEKIKESGLQAAIEDLLSQINQQMSTYLPDSEISQFNQSESTEWFAVSDDFALVSGKAKEIYQHTKGKFDPTLGPLINLWSFGADQRPTKIPTAQDLEQVAQKFGSNHLEIQLEPAALKKSIPDLNLNLSAIAKGFAVDELAELLESNKIENFLIDIGGELRSKGMNQQGQSWRVAIEKPNPGENQSVQQVVSITDKSIATSGSYRNFFEENGVRYSHIIDPQTYQPIEHKLVSVSVIADNCMTADGYATALMVLGPELGYDFALQYGLAVYMIEKQGDEFVIKTTPQIKPFME